MRCASGTLCLTDALVVATGTRGHDLGSDVPHALARLVEVLDGDVEVCMTCSPKLEYGLAVPSWQRDDAGAATTGGPERLFLRGDAPCELDGSTACAHVHLRAGQHAGWILHRAARHVRPGAAAAGPAERDRGHDRRVALVVRRARRLRGRARRSGPVRRPRAARPDLPTERSRRRRRHDVATGDRRRRGQLGLPLWLAARRRDDRARAVRLDVRRGVTALLRLDGARRRHVPRRGAGADRLRRRRRARPLRARARAPRRAPRIAARARRQRRLAPEAARRARPRARQCVDDPRSSWTAPTSSPAASCASSPTAPRGSGARPTRASGRAARASATTSSRRSAAGWRSIARCGSATAWATPPTDGAGRARATSCAGWSCARASTSGAARSPAHSAPTTSTRACCCWRSRASSSPTTRA